MAISFAAARSAPLLDVEQERVLIRRWQVDRDRAALEVVIIAHARLVHACAMRLRPQANDRDELVAEGMMGLIRAASRFDLKRDVRFSTYAHWWILNSVMRAIAHLSSVIDIPARARREAVALKRVESLAGDRPCDVGEAIHCPEPTPEERMIARSANARLRQVIVEAMGELGDVEREVVVSRNLRQVPDTIEDLALRLGVSREKLRLIERRAMSRLKYGLLTRGVTAAQLG